MQMTTEPLDQSRRIVISVARKTVPLREDLHQRLKVLAAQRNLSLSLLLDQFVETGLKASENHKDGDAA